ncbi:uncharacterized protein LOC118477140 [Aplysia californica]|uniref:Uncharacterized protein LOC118477140 n=1 Tax=Aplysia californica TaxID=6500 RepID=A0ABM1VPA2_APLCA|nr:uncharacterized protein LOC118477140 [Aplysia californica]
MSRAVDVCCIEKDEVIGDAEMGLDLPINTETVVSTASTTVLVLNTKNYERLVSRKHAFTVTRLQRLALNKVSTRANSSKGSLVPLLKHLARELSERIPKPPPPAKRVEILKKKEVVMNQLLDMFLKDKAPLIEPCVPNALFYRQRSAVKNQALMQNPYAKLRTLKHIDDFGKIRRKVPRSIQQLKNNLQAERELLGDDRRELVDTSFDDNAGTLSRPMTSLGFSRGSPRSRMSRPTTSHSLRIRECRQEDDRYSTSANHPDKEDRLDHNAVADIFEEMEMITRENQENRMRLICSVSAKNELKEKLERVQRAASLEKEKRGEEFGELYDTDYFDWETSEDNLKDLEDRVVSFCRSVTPARPSSAVTRSTAAKQMITEMKRFEVEDPSLVPLPGGTVYVHKKPCRFARSKTPASTSVHKHVRRFMLSREPEVWTRGNTPAATEILY